MDNKRKTPAAQVALGGVLAALAVVIMGMGTVIPIATYAAPVTCALILQIVLKTCGGRMAWAWYGAVGFLSALLAPDKEAAAVFIFLGLLSHRQAPAGQNKAQMAVEGTPV